MSRSGRDPMLIAVLSMHALDADIPADALSWVAMLIPAAAAFGVGVYAARAGARYRTASPRPG